MTTLTTAKTVTSVAMDQSIKQIVAAAKLIGACESIAGSGLLDEVSEMMLREHIAEARAAFRLYPEIEAAA